MRLIFILLMVFFNISVGSAYLTLISDQQVKALRTYVPSKLEYKHLGLSQLPTSIQGEIDVLKIMVDSSLLTPKVLSILSKEEIEILDTVSFLLKNNILSTAKGVWRDFLLEQKNNNRPLDLNILIGKVVYDAFIVPNKELLFYSSRFSMLNKTKMDTFTQLREIRSQLIDCKKREIHCSYKLIKEMKDLITDTKDRLTFLGDSAEMSLIDLQNSLSKNAQIIQVISNASKSMHDVAVSVIREVN